MKTVFRKLTAIALTLMFVLSFAGCNGATVDKNAVKNSIEAKVNGNEIDISDAFEHFKSIEFDSKTVFTKDDLTKHYEAVKNGEDVGTENFKVMRTSDGNIKIIISEDYLKSLSNGDHTLKVLTKTGETDNIKIVKDKDTVKIADTLLDFAKKDAKTEDTKDEATNEETAENTAEEAENLGTDSGSKSSDNGNTKQNTKSSASSGNSDKSNTGKSNSGNSSGSNSSTTATTTQASASPERNYGYASQFLSLLNSYRASLGLSQLGMEGFMQEHCMQRAYDLTYDFSHNTHGRDPLAGCPTITKTDEIPEYDAYGAPTGNTVKDTYQTYAYGANGECIGGTVPASPSAMLESFKASGQHNAILTKPGATHVGIGVVSYNGNDYYCVVTYTAH